MNAHTSDLGIVLRRTFGQDQHQCNQDGGYLTGWKEAPELPSLDGINETYRNLLALDQGAELALVSEVAATLESYRGTLTFIEDNVEHFAQIFFYAKGSLFLVFSSGAQCSVRLYYMGVDESIDDKAAAKHCSAFAMLFSEFFDDSYFDLRDSTLGRFGMGEAAP